MNCSAGNPPDSKFSGSCRIVLSCRRRFALVLTILTAVLLYGCAGADTGRPVDESAYTGTIKLACIGNSITYGHGIEDRDRDSYPAQLDRMLSDRWEVRNFGVSGATLLKEGNKPYRDESMFTAALAFEPDVVVIQLGTNDSKPVNWDVHSNSFIEDYLALIEQFRELDSHPRIWICLPVPAYDMRWDIRNEVIVDQIMPMIREVADRAHVPLIDMFVPLSGHEDLFPDDIHPNVEGAGMIAREVRRALVGT
ncbi:MAG: GDSL-type esterase/lipase family protein [Acidobacteriota bacterium]